MTQATRKLKALEARDAARDEIKRRMGCGTMEVYVAVERIKAQFATQQLNDERALDFLLGVIKNNGVERVRIQYFT